MSAIFESKRLRPKPSPHTRPPSPLPLGRLFRRPAFFPPPRNEAGTAAFFDSQSFGKFVCFRRSLSVIGHKLPVMHFLVCQNVLPVVVTVLVILISWYLWRRTFKGPSSNSGEEPTASGCEKIETAPTAEQKVSLSQHSSFLVLLSSSVYLKYG